MFDEMYTPANKRLHISMVSIQQCSYVHRKDAVLPIPVMVLEFSYMRNNSFGMQSAGTL
jgi:hypothetical protein